MSDSISQDNLQIINSHEAGDQTDDHKYVIFSLGDELYGAKLLEVKEVVEMLPTKQVPNTIPSFKGVCNLRGQIIGVIELRTHFNIHSAASLRPLLLVFDSEQGTIAAVIDRVVSVSVIGPADVETKPNIVSSIPAKYIIGIGKLGERMVTLVDLKSILSQEELAHLDHLKTSSHVSMSPEA